jgi:hypothetical protein
VQTELCKRAAAMRAVQTVLARKWVQQENAGIMMTHLEDNVIYDSSHHGCHVHRHGLIPTCFCDLPQTVASSSHGAIETGNDVVDVGRRKKALEMLAQASVLSVDRSCE